MSQFTIKVQRVGFDDVPADVVSLELYPESGAESTARLRCNACHKALRSRPFGIAAVVCRGKSTHVRLCEDCCEVAAPLAKKVEKLDV